jgi:hypothetical protein
MLYMYICDVDVRACIGIIALVLCGGKQNGGVIPVNKNLWSLSFVCCQSSLGNSGCLSAHDSDTVMYLMDDDDDRINWFKHMLCVD